MMSIILICRDALIESLKTLKNCLYLCYTLAVFIMYIMMIVYRYILNWKISELFEATQILYMMLAMTAASYAGRTGRHVVFPLVYNKVSAKMKNIFRLISSAVVVVLAGMMIAPSWESISFIAKKKTSILKVPFNIVYMPFLIFMVLSMIYYVIEFIKELRILMGKAPDTEAVATTSEEQKEVAE